MQAGERFSDAVYFMQHARMTLGQVVVMLAGVGLVEAVILQVHAPEIAHAALAPVLYMGWWLGRTLFPSRPREKGH